MFSIKWIVIFVTIHLTRAAVGSTIAPHPSSINSSTVEAAKDEWTDFLPNTTVCGISSHFDQFPWMALIEYGKPNGTHLFLGGGILINKRYVLTTAQATIASKKWKILGVRLGENNIDTDPDCIKTVRGIQCAPTPLDIGVEESIVHEGFVSKGSYRHDVCLLKLKREVEFTETVRPICLPVTSEGRRQTYVGRRLTVAGWGKTENGSNPSMKRKVKVPVTDQEACKLKYNTSGVDLGDGQLCAGGEQGRGTCKGDGGNPLMAPTVDENAEMRWYAVGILSVGPILCGLKDWPSVYTNVSAYIPWILNKLTTVA